MSYLEAWCFLGCPTIPESPFPNCAHSERRQLESFPLSNGKSGCHFLFITRLTGKCYVHQSLLPGTVQPLAACYLSRFLPSFCLYSLSLYPRCTTMQASGEDLVTQFTEDAFAKDDRVCQRSRCQASIRKGDPCHYVAAYDPSQPGKFVCGKCYSWYKNKPATTTVRAQHTKGTYLLLVPQ